MKENYKEILNKNSEVPEIVNLKCREAYTQILSDSKTIKHKKCFNKKYTAMIGIAAAVAVGFSVPVMAEYIPIFRNAYEAVTNNVYTKSPQSKNNLTEYSENFGLYHQGKYADITIDNIYFDGDDISFSYMLSTKDNKLKKSTGISANAVIFLGDNEKNLVKQNEIITFSLIEDGNYYGTYSHHVSDLKITDTTKLYIKFFDLEGRDYYTQVLSNDTAGKSISSYEPKITEQINEIYEFQCDITPNTSIKKNYPLNKTKDGITLESIDVSPFRTTINIKNMPEDNNHSIRLKDNNGNEYSPILNAEEELLWDGSGWEAPLKDAKSITIEIFRLDKDNFPTETTFTVPIEKGYREKYNVEYDNTKEIIYIPPIDKLEAQNEEQLNKVKASILKNSKKLEVNEKLYSNEYNINIAVTGSEIVNDFSKYELTDTGKSELEYIKESCNEELALYLVDYEISNPSNAPKTFYFTGFELYDEKLNNSQLCSIEPTYVSVIDHGGKDGYQYDIEANETRHITIGFIVSKRTAENITFAVPQSPLSDNYNIDTIAINAGNDPEKIKEYTDEFIIMKVK